MTTQQHFEAACKALGIKDADLLISENMPVEMRDDTVKFFMLKLIAKHWNDGWVANWDDRGEKKWFPVMYKAAPGSGFSLIVVYYSDAWTCVGARLPVFRTEELAEKAAEELQELYN